jgi:hypothetical protein
LRQIECQVRKEHPAEKISNFAFEAAIGSQVREERGRSFAELKEKFRVDSLHRAMGFGIAIALSSSMSGAEVRLEMYR